MATELGHTRGISFTRFSAENGCRCQVSLGREFIHMYPSELRALAQHALRTADACEGKGGYGMDTTPRDLSEHHARGLIDLLGLAAVVWAARRWAT